MKRSSGVLMHVSSLFGDYSVGSFGKSARYFVDFLSDSGFSYWQVLPFCMPDEYNSPYKSYSAFGANPWFIDLEELYASGLVTASELEAAKQSTPYIAEYERYSERMELLFAAASRVKDRCAVKKFLEKYEEYAHAAEFLALRDANGEKPWQQWSIFKPDEDVLFAYGFIQYEFFRQWQSIKAYANSKGIKVVGDVPIYVSSDSADVYYNKELFLLDSQGYPAKVAGVPPDYFSAEGQLWGNPLYDYKKMKCDGYAWWKKRIEYVLELFDGVRIDHFRGFESFYAVPATAKNAKCGKWIKAPGREIVDAIRSVAGDKLIIAEDLGDITPKVHSLLKYSGFPGMRVFQFGFLGDTTSLHTPHNYSEHSIAYSGTHDNNTLLGYIWEMTPECRRDVFDYVGERSCDFAAGLENIIRCLLRSKAAIAILPIQDIFGYGADTRMNVPGSADGNWRYRITREQLDAVDREKFRRMNKLYGRM